MTPRAAYSLAVVCEAERDRFTATSLADRILCQEVEWIEPESLDLHRTWRGLEDGQAFLDWHALKKVKIRPHGHFEGRPGAPGALMARKALLQLAACINRPDAVLLIWERPTALNEPGKSGLRNLKRVLEHLTGADRDREDACWLACDLEILMARGRETGLAELIEEVRSRLVPLFLKG